MSNNEEADRCAERIMAWLLTQTDMESWRPRVIAEVRARVERIIADAWPQGAEDLNEVDRAHPQ